MAEAIIRIITVSEGNVGPSGRPSDQPSPSGSQATGPSTPKQQSKADIPQQEQQKIAETAKKADQVIGDRFKGILDKILDVFGGSKGGSGDILKTIQSGAGKTSSVLDDILSGLGASTGKTAGRAVSSMAASSGAASASTAAAGAGAASALSSVAAAAGPLALVFMAVDAVTKKLVEGVRQFTEDMSSVIDKDLWGLFDKHVLKPMEKFGGVAGQLIAEIYRSAHAIYLKLLQDADRLSTFSGKIMGAKVQAEAARIERGFAEARALEGPYSRLVAAQVDIENAAMRIFLPIKKMLAEVAAPILEVLASILNQVANIIEFLSHLKDSFIAFNMQIAKLVPGFKEVTDVLKKIWESVTKKEPQDASQLTEQFLTSLGNPIMGVGFGMPNVIAGGPVGPENITFELFNKYKL